MPENPYGQTFIQSVAQDHGLDEALDQTFIELAQPAINDGHHVTIDLPIRNVNRTVGTLLGHEVTKRWGGAGLPDGTIDITLTGSAGQSFGAFVPAGIQMRLVGDANDYLGKGLSGGRLIVHPHPFAPFVAEDNVIAGNVIAYGATSGEIFLRGRVGERFCVRNSGATAVERRRRRPRLRVHDRRPRRRARRRPGRNFGAGMSGGIAYVYDPDDEFASLVNYEMVDARGTRRRRPRVPARRRSTRHRDFTGSAVAERVLADWDTEVGRFRKVMPTDYKRVLDRDRDARPRARRAQTVDRIMEAARHERMIGIPTSGVERRGAHEDRPTRRTRNGQADRVPGVVAVDAGATAGAGAAARLARGVRAVRSRRAQPPGGPLHGLRHPVLQQRLPARQPDPRLERPRLPRPLAGRDRAAPRHEQLPRVHRPAVPGAVRVGVRARASTRTRWRSSRSRSRSSTGPGTRAGSCRRCRRCAPASASPWSAAGPAGLAAAQQLTRAGHEVVVLERADRIGGLLRYGIPEFKMEKRHIDRRLEQMEAEGTEFRTNAVVGETVDIEVLRASHDAIVLACGATDWRDLPIPGPRARRASTRRWSTCRTPTGCSSATSSSHRSTSTASTS